jgi:hypothetical protein
MKLSGQLCASAALAPGNGAQVPMVQEAGWALESVWTLQKREKSLATVGQRTPTIQTVSRRYSDWAISIPSHCAGISQNVILV